MGVRKMAMQMREMLQLVNQWGATVEIKTTPAGPTLAVFPMTGRPLQQSKVKNMMSMIRAREAEAIYALTHTPAPLAIPPTPDAVRARIAELEAELIADCWTGSQADAVKVCELNALAWLDCRPGAEECDVTGKPWAALYLEYQ